MKTTEKSNSTMRAKRAKFTVWENKSWLKMPKMGNLAIFWKPKACGQTVLPDRLLLKGQKLVENAKIEKFECDIFVGFEIFRWYCSCSD